MITIFCDFWQFSAKKICVFLTNQWYARNFANFSFVLSQKRQFFSLNFLAKNHNIGPRSPWLWSKHWPHGKEEFIEWVKLSPFVNIELFKFCYWLYVWESFSRWYGIQRFMKLGCQMVCFETKIPIWVNFGGSCDSRWWYIIRPFCLFYGHLAIFYGIW
jgi:hypothetical protein